MEIQVSKLRETLEMLKPAVARKATLKEVESAWLGDGKAVATDMETAVKVNLPDIAGEAPLLLPFKDALEFLKRAPGHRMAHIASEGKTVRMSVDGAQASFQAEDVQDYPPLPPVEGEGQGVLDGDALLSAMLAVAPYAATEDVRPVLKAVCLTPGDTIEVAGADGFRLAWEQVPGKLATEKQMVIPTNTIEVLDHLWKRAARPDLSAVSDPASLARAKRLIRLSWTDSRLQFSFGEVAVITQLVQGSFPNYRQLVPSSSNATVTLMAEDMERALRQLSLAARDGSGIVRLTWEGEQLRVSAKSEKFESSVPVLATCSGPGKVAVSVKFLLEYFRGRTGMVTMSWSSPSSPMVFSRRDHPHVVMMPMFVKWEDEQQAPEEGPVEETKAEPAGDPVVDTEAEETEAVAEVEHAGEAETVTDDVETTETEKPEPPPRKSKRPRRKVETSAS